MIALYNTISYIFTTLGVMSYIYIHYSGVMNLNLIRSVFKTLQNIYNGFFFRLLNGFTIFAKSSIIDVSQVSKHTPADNSTFFSES